MVWEKLNAVFLSEYVAWDGFEIISDESDEEEKVEESKDVRSHLWHYHEGEWYDIMGADQENKSPFSAKIENGQLIIQKKGTQELFKQ